MSQPANASATAEPGPQLNEDERLLASVPLLAALSPQEIRRLAGSLEIHQYDAGEILFREGERGESFYIIQSGQIEVIKSLGTAGERRIAVRGPGEFIGEMSLLDVKGLRTASARAAQPSRLWVLQRADFDALLHRQPMLAYAMVRMLADRLNNAHNAAIQELLEKNLQLSQAYEELKAAQVQLIEKERLERELQVAYDIQMSVLPRSLPGLPGYEFGARITPARSVGGDFYDFVPLSAERVAISIGDVTDKGVPAAIFASQVHALLRAETGKKSSPSRVLRNANRHLLDMNARGLFATVLFGILDCRSGEFSYARAGHDLPLLVNAEGQASLLAGGTGQPLGILDKPELDEQVVHIPPGGFLLLYTDGATDGRSPSGELFGAARLKLQLSRCTGKPAQQTCDELMDAMVGFQAGAAQEDDITLAVVRCSG